MNANQAYFQRLNGPWTFRPVFVILSWRGLLRSEFSFVNKVKLIVFVLFQKLFGPYRMNTLVDFESGSDKVRHSTVVQKFGVQILRSEKIFLLDENGFDVKLSGAEYYWPRTWRPVPFVPMSGRVNEGATRAQYGMPLMGLKTECQALMEAPQASIKISLPWFEGVFNFTVESMATLNSRELPFMRPEGV
jgi:hypothetical protein